MVQVVEDGHGPPPGSAGIAGLARRGEGIAEPHESVGFVPPVAQIAPPVDGVLITLRVIGVPTAMVIGVAETVPRLRQAIPVADLAVRRERPLAVFDGPLRVAEQCVEPADGVECLSVPGMVVTAFVPVERLMGAVE